MCIRDRFYPRIVNLTEINFNNVETNLLNKGLKYCFKNKGFKQSLINEILNAETAINAISDEETRTVVRHAVDNKIKKVLKAENIKTSYNKETKIFNEIKRKLIDNNNIVTKADKRQTPVILTNEDYKRKIQEFFINNNIIEIKSDPTDRFNSNVKSVLNKTKYIITNDEKKYLKMIDSKAPRLRGLPKIHKNNTPVRSLVNFTSAPSYKIAKKN